MQPADEIAGLMADRAMEWEDSRRDRAVLSVADRQHWRPLGPSLSPWPGEDERGTKSVIRSREYCIPWRHTPGLDGFQTARSGTGRDKSLASESRCRDSGHPVIPPWRLAQVNPLTRSVDEVVGIDGPGLRQV